MYSRKRDGTAFLVSVICHVVFLIILTIFLHERKEEKVSSFVELDIVNIANPEPKRRFRQMAEAPPLDDLIKVYNISKESEIRPELITPDVQFQVAMPDIPVSSSISTLADRLREKESDNLSAPVPSPSRVRKRSGISRTIIVPRRIPITRRIDIAKPEKTEGSMDDMLQMIAKHIADLNETGKEDLVFLIDTSGSMEKYIIGVANYLTRMADILINTGIDYTFGIITFNRQNRQNNIEIFEQTKDVEQSKRTLRSIKCSGDERALDAIAEGLSKVKFRKGSNRTFVLVTNEKLTGGHSIDEIIEESKKSAVRLNVIGIDDPGHRELAIQTGGLWFQAPE